MPLFKQREHKPKDDVPDMLEAALDHLAQGRSIFPVCKPKPGGRGCYHHVDCKHPGKTPLVSWKKNQTELPTEAQVRRWWSGSWADANIGAATGAISDFVVLDLDSAEAVAFATEQGGLEIAPRVSTGGGGVHVYFTHPGEHVSNFAGNHWEHVDFRGDGGYVLVEPSLHASGRRYERQADSQHELTPVPAWLMAALKRDAKADVAKETPAPIGGGLDLRDYVYGIPEGARDTMLFKLACKLRGDGIEQDLAEAIVVLAARNCDPPFDDDEARAKVERAWEKYPGPVRLIWDDEESSEAYADEDNGVFLLPDRRPYPIISFREFMAVEDEAEEWLAEGLLRKGCTHWFFADPGVGKTLIALFLAVHIAAGLPIGDLQVDQGTVLIISEDMGKLGFRRYLRKVVRGAGLDPDTTDLPIYVNDESGLRIDSPEGLAVAWKIIERVNPSLVILDSCERVNPSETFNSKEFDAFIQLLNRSTSKGITTIVIDHTSKGKDGQTASVNRIYGGRSKSACADVILRFKGAVKDGQVRMEQVKERGEPTYPYDIKTIAAGDSLSFQVISTVVGPKTDEQRDVLKWLDRRPGEGRRATEVAESLNMPGRTAQRVLSELVQLNLVHRDEDHGVRGGRSFLYRTPTLDDNDELGVASA